MSERGDAVTSTKKETGGLFHRLFGRSERAGASPGSEPLDLEDIQGLILRGYRMPIVRHFLLKVDVPASSSVGSRAATKPTHPRSRRPGTGTSDSSRAPETTGPSSRAASPTIA
jgi:hypothetical protein